MTGPAKLEWDEPCPSQSCVRTGPHPRCRSSLTAALIDDTYTFASGGIVTSAGTGSLPGSRYTYPSTATATSTSTAGSALIIGGSSNGKVIPYNPASVSLHFATYTATAPGYTSMAEAYTSPSFTAEAYSVRFFAIYDFAAEAHHTFAAYVQPGADEDKASEFVHSEWRAGRLIPIRTMPRTYFSASPTTTF